MRFTQYSDIEERFFFPALEEFVEIRALINDAYRAHKRISELVEKMEKLRLAKQCDRWDEDLTQLMHILRRHFDWEEHALFPRAIRLLGEARLERMLFEIEAASSGQSEQAVRFSSIRASASVFEYDMLEEQLPQHDACNSRAVTGKSATEYMP